MVDIPGDSTTTRTITVGETINDQLEITNDRDWFRITLTAGQSISISLEGLTLEDPYLRVRDQNGNILFENDDSGSLDSLLAFTASYTGVYFIDVGAWEPPVGHPDYPGYTGTYSLSVATYTPPPLATFDQVANQLIEGYWDGNDHHFDVAQGGTLTVNLTALTADGATLAREALARWTDIIGVSFSEVLTGGQITFDDNQEGAFATGNWSGGITSSAHVNISTDWLEDYGTTLHGYAFQTYIHEIGHALGLGHAGNYNDTARYPFDASFENDSWPVSVMSYFDQQENTFFAGQGFAVNFITTPMISDILAMSTLYGLSTNTRSGNTSYGGDWFNGMGAICIFDSGGIDTINASPVGGNHTINLNPGTFSTVMNELGLVSIALGTIIENATTSSGSDTLIGNDVANILDSGAGSDTLVGGGGDDWLLPGAGSNNVDGGTGIDIVDYIQGLAGNVTVNLAFGAATYNGGLGNDVLSSIENVRGTTEHDSITGTDAANYLEGHLGNDLLIGGGGADTLVGDTPGPQFGGDDTLTGGLGIDLLTGNFGNDTFRDTAAGLNGDTIADLRADEKIIITDATLAGFTFSLTGNVLTYTGGSVTLSLVPAGQIIASAAAGGGVQLIISSVSDARDDFNGDGRSDILWRHTDGTIGDWLANADATFTSNGASVTNVPAYWSVTGTGDFNGDGRDDILWRGAAGEVGNWLANSDGGFTYNAAAGVTAIPTSWQVEAIGDFNGDNRDDLLWRHSDGTTGTWFGAANGGFVANNGSVFTVSADWHIIATGDFNGDGRDDILWRHDSGTIANWLSDPEGNVAPNHSSLTGITNDWHIIGTGDFNGDGRDDILWRHDSGTIANWTANANATFSPNFASLVTITNDWNIAGIGDYNGDNRDDILWRHDSGTVADWTANANASFSPNNSSFVGIPNDWHVQSPDTLWV